MRGKNSIIINGRHYDAVSGLPVDSTEATPTTHVSTVVKKESSAEKVTVAVKKPTSVPKMDISRPAAKSAKHTPHHSKTLRRDLVKKPSGAHDHTAKNVKQHTHVARSPQIAKFAPHPIVEKKVVSPAQADKHSAVVANAHHKFAVAQSAAHKPKAMSSRELKDHLIATKLAEAQPNKKQVKTKKFHAPRRISSIMAACFAVMLLGGYLSYINMPSLSVRVAASQAGVDAEYPGYTPSGYRFDGPVSYGDGTVTLSFAANGGNNGYAITQKRSTWDSQSVLDNLVAKATEHYTINSSQGLTIYTYGPNAAWVNHGVLYTLNGDAPLKTDQVLRIANSL